MGMDSPQADLKVCPLCGNSVSTLTAIDAGLKLRLQEGGQASSELPEQACLDCYNGLRQSSSHGAKVREQAKARERNRINLWTGRVALIKKARSLMQAKSYSEAAVAYEKYIRSLEIVFDVKPGGLTPAHFKNQMRQKELTVIASVYWDLICIYDTSGRYGNRQNKAVDKLVEFCPFTPIYPSLMKKAQSFLRRSKNPKVIKRFLREAQSNRPRCFIATAISYPQASEVITLCAFRDEVLARFRLGQFFIAGYYRISPPIAAVIDHCPPLRWSLLPCLKLTATLVRRLHGSLKTLAS